MMRRLFVALIVIISVSGALAQTAPATDRYSILGYTLGQSEQQAKELANANGMSNFTCVNQSKHPVRDCTATTSKGATLVFHFMFGGAVCVDYKYPGSAGDFEKLIKSLEKRYRTVAATEGMMSVWRPEDYNYLHRTHVGDKLSISFDKKTHLTYMYLEDIDFWPPDNAADPVDVHPYTQTASAPKKQVYSILGFALKQSEQAARETARTNGMSDFSCEDLDSKAIARSCVAKASDGKKTMTFHFLNGKAVEINYVFPDSNIKQLARACEEKYGPAQHTYNTNESGWERSDGNNSSDDPNGLYDKFSIGVEKPNDTLWIKLSDALEVTKFDRLASEKFRQSMRDAFRQAIQETKQNENKKEPETKH